MPHTNEMNRNGNAAAAPDPLLEQLVAGDGSVPELAARCGWSLVDLAAWMAHPGNRAMLAQLAALEDARAQMLISRFRASAAIQLAAIACRDEPDESSRKACVDLLKIGLDLRAGDDEHTGCCSGREDDDRTGSRHIASPEAILAALEEIGRDDDVRQCDQAKGAA